MVNINVDLLQWIINFFIKKSSGRKVKNENVSNKELAEELRQPIFRKFKKRRAHSAFMNTIWVLILLIYN